MILIKLKDYFDKLAENELEIDVCETEDHAKKYLELHFNDYFEPSIRCNLYHEKIRLPKKSILLKIDNRDIDFLAHDDCSSFNINRKYIKLLWNKKMFWADSKYFQEI
jgi:hypothetical protein